MVSFWSSRPLGQLWWAASAALIALFATRPSGACPNFLDPAGPVVPTTQNCPTCHVDGAFLRNSFGSVWETACSGCTATTGACPCAPTAWEACSTRTEDTDADGFSNEEELQFGTSPSVAELNDECVAGRNACVPEASCSDPSPAPGDYVCSCPLGYGGAGSNGRSSGGGCPDINECDDPGTACPDANSACTNSPGTWDCPCNPGFFGSGKTAQGCSAINYCDGNPCSPLSTCRSGATDFDCRACPKGYAGDVSACPACPPGYAGDARGPNGCQQVDECQADNGGCSPRVECIDQSGGRRCGACPAGFSGDGVGDDGCTKDECRECAPFAHCNPGAAQPCECNLGFTGNGQTCSDVNECEVQGRARCPEHATCQNIQGSFSCPCDPGYRALGDGCVALVAPSTADVAPPAPPPPSAAPKDDGGCSLAPYATLRPSSSGGLVASGWLSGFVLLSLLRRRGRLAGLLSLLAVLGGCGGEPKADDVGLGVGGAPPSGASGGAPSSEAPVDGLPGPGCTHSRECAAGEWCNPDGQLCQTREPAGPALTFRDIFPVVTKIGCVTCHAPGERGDVDRSEHLLLDNFERAYSNLVAGGVNCNGGLLRMCVDDPKSSRLITKVFKGASDTVESIAFTEWSDKDLQQLLLWIAQGAPRDTLCGNAVRDAGEECDLGAQPPVRCGYGETACDLCTTACRVAHTTEPGPRCGDGTLDAAYEICDPGSLPAEPVGPNGGAICGPACTFIPGAP
jgi:Calcium-binding EGF domain